MRRADAGAATGGGAGARQSNCAGDAVVMGVSRWKRGFVRPFIAAPRAHVTYRKPSPPPPGMRALSGRRAKPRGSTASTRIEDGFLRSAGLGSNFLPALSLVLDSDGIYFDPSPTERHREDPQRSGAFRRKRCAPTRNDCARVSWPAASANTMCAATTPTADRATASAIILVPGQVEDDQSILRGSPVDQAQSRSAEGGARGVARRDHSLQAASRDRSRQPARRGARCRRAALRRPIPRRRRA